MAELWLLWIILIAFHGIGSYQIPQRQTKITNNAKVSIFTPPLDIILALTSTLKVLPFGQTNSHIPNKNGELI